MNATLRNVLIVVALAAAVTFLPGGGRVTNALLALLSLIFLGTLVWFGGRLYRQARSEIYGLGDQRRALAYGSLGVIVVALSGTGRMWDTGAGTLAWLVLVGGACWALVWVWRGWRSYG